jgi:hypothetical protein
MLLLVVARQVCRLQYTTKWIEHIIISEANDYDDVSCTVSRSERYSAISREIDGAGRQKSTSEANRLHDLHNLFTNYWKTTKR